jgi:hypothetical protein
LDHQGLRQTGGAARTHGQNGMKNILFTCPITKQSVQHRIQVTPDHDHDYESVSCLACAGVHFIHLKTGKVLRRERE